MWCRRCRDDFPESSRVGCAPTRCRTHQRCLHCYMLGRPCGSPRSPVCSAHLLALSRRRAPNRRLHDRYPPALALPIRAQKRSKSSRVSALPRLGGGGLMIYSLAASRGASWLGLWLLLGALSPKSRSDARVHDSSRLPSASRSGTKKGIGMPWLIALPAAHGESDSLRPPVRPSDHRPSGVSRGRTDDGCSQLVNPDTTRVRDRSVRTGARIFCSTSRARTDGTNRRTRWMDERTACTWPGRYTARPPANVGNGVMPAARARRNEDLRGQV